MPRTLLLIVLALAAALELGLAGGVFLAPAFTLAQFGVTYGPSTKFLTYLIAWFLLLVTLLALLAFGQVQRRRRGYAGTCYLLGLWWIGLGVGIYVAFGKPDNLLLDSVKGLLIVVLTWRCQAGGLQLRR